MKILNLIPGSAEWHEHRLRSHNSAEAQAMLGESKKVVREDLLDAKKTGIPAEYSTWVEEKLFPRGHEVEAAARPIGEKILGEALYPVIITSDDGFLSASLDGLTMDETRGWECKQWNTEKVADVLLHRVPDADRWQVCQQLACGVEEVLYMVTDGTEERCVHMRVTRDYFSEADYRKLRAGWVQFDKDLETHEVRKRHVEVIGAKPKALPPLVVRLSGEVVETNIQQFREQSVAMIDGQVPAELVTDQDFADADEAVKWCKEVEQRLDNAKKQALSETADIYALMNTIDEIREYARAKRLPLERQVTERKKERKAEIVRQAEQELQKFIAEAEALIKPVKLDRPRVAFGDAVKNKRTLESMIAACNDVLTRERLEINERANAIRANLDWLRETVAEEHRHLFRDVSVLVVMDPVALEAITRNRIAEHNAAVTAAAEERARKDREAEERRALDAQEADARAAQEAEARAARETEAAANLEPDAKPAADPAPAAPSLEQGAPAGLGRVRPSDRDIVLAICRAYRVKPSVAIDWLRTINLDAVSDAA